ncbi:MAG: LTA synthase family protein [Candidatus Rifleibacteriota bacterium]
MIQKLKNINPLHASITLFFLILLSNHVYIQIKTQLPVNVFVLKAHLTGLVNELFLPTLIVVLFLKLPLRNRTRLTSLTIFFQFIALMPLLDILYFQATLHRFNWKIWHDVNFYSIKAFFGYKELLFLSFWALIYILVFLKLKKSPANKFKTIKIDSIAPKFLVLLILIYLFVPFELYKINSKFDNVACPIRGKNNFLKIINNGFLNNFLEFPKTIAKNTTKNLQYTKSETAFLIKNGFIAPSIKKINFKAKNYNKIIFVVFESLAADYLHSYNPNIPSEATPFFDSLISNYTDVPQFYASDCPTINGLNAMLLSRIPFDPDFSMISNHISLAKLLKKYQGFDSVFLRGVSKFYSGENILIKSLFSFDKLICFEELKKKYPEPPFRDWGFHDDTIFKEAIDILEKHKNKKLFLLLKTIDLHQPPHYCGLPDSKLPLKVRNHPSPIIKSLYWADYSLKSFFKTLEDKKLFDNKTLIIITSDHYAFPGYGHSELVNKPVFSQIDKIPLIFVDKKQNFRNLMSTNKKFCQIDLAPTICHLLGLPVPDSFIGQSMLNPNARSRILGIDNDKIILRNEKKEYSLELNEKRTNQAIEKWLNNLTALAGK